MKVLMLGWEYPPHISGGLGTACEGITTGLARHDVEVLFVVPHLFGGEDAGHMTIVNSLGQTPAEVEERRRSGSWAEGANGKTGKITRKAIPALLQPYFTPETFKQYVKSLQTAAKKSKASGVLSELASRFPNAFNEEGEEKKSFAQYGQDIFAEVGRFAANVTSSLAGESFDVIHCHDWMTYPAGMALAEITGKPLVVHVHSLEYDRSGQNVNQQIHQIERMGIHAAKAVLAVSYYTRNIIHQQHGAPLDKIYVAHNGVYSKEAVHTYRTHKNLHAKVVLFLGRITFQKGPDYFVEAAARVIPHVPDVLFVMAGSGDMLQRCKDRVQELGISQHFQFPGFLKGQEVEEMFSLADVYVMPSVSEPFGISALEAIKFDTPVIISRQSGVSEVLSHALKVDFWDVDRQADLLINALLHDELRADMVAMAREEVKRQHWDAAALKMKEVYSKLVQ